MSDIFHVDRLFKNPNLSKQEKDILKQIVKEPEEIRKKGIRQLAKEHYTSPASIVRLAQKLGYSGYNELIFDVKRMINSVGVVNRSKLKSYSSLSSDELDEIMISCLGKDRYKYIYGEGFCEYVTGYIHRKLLVNKHKVILLHGLEIPIVYEEEHNPTLILVSRSGENFSCIKKIEHLRKYSGNIITFTSNSNSTMYKKSDVAFCIEDKNFTDTKNEYFTNFYGDCINLFENLLDQYAR